MKSYCLLGLIVAMAGCGKVAELTSHVFAAPPVQHDWVEEMKAVARTRHMRYRIFCMDWRDDPEQQFQAMLCSQDCNSSHGLDLDDQTWQFGTGPTQAEAAHNLLRNITVDDWYYPKPRATEKGKERTHKTCPPEIDGGPQ
jgi:hypothetical protein